MVKEFFVDRMRGKDILRSLSAVELLLLALWCILELIYKLVNVSFAAVDRILGKRFEQYRSLTG